MQDQQPSAGQLIATIETNHGTMRLSLFDQLVPTAVQNFVELASQEKYTNVPFHRVIEGFMIQGGDFTNKNGTGGHASAGPGSNIDDDFHADLKHLRGALSYAKTNRPNSIGSQFFIVHQPAHFLDYEPGKPQSQCYTVFGQLFEGFEVLDAIANLPTDRSDRPREDATILSIKISKFE
jgi:peptidyl-prolyl cis-trans isomerase B (cyclophilin B)